MILKDTTKNPLVPLYIKYSLGVIEKVDSCRVRCFGDDETLRNREGGGEERERESERKKERTANTIYSLCPESPLTV